jgi:hypothetical protein
MIANSFQDVETHRLSLGSRPQGSGAYPALGVLANTPPTKVLVDSQLTLNRGLSSTMGATFLIVPGVGTALEAGCRGVTEGQVPRPLWMGS